MYWKQRGKRHFALYKEGAPCLFGLLGLVEMEKYTQRWGGSIIGDDGWPTEPKYFNTKAEAMAYVEINVN